MRTALPPATALRPAQVKRPRPRLPRFRASRHLSMVLVGLILIVQVYPLFWIVVTSLRPARSFASGNAFAIPAHLTLANFERAFQLGDLPRFVWNSMVVTVSSDIVIVIAGMMGAYAIQVLGFRFSRVVLGIFLTGIVIPVQVALVPLFTDYSHVGLLSSYPSLVLPLAGFGLPMSVYLFMSFYSYIPRETYEAATLDGCGPYRLFLRITAPMAAGTIITVVFINTIFIWNDFIFANTFVINQSRLTVPLGLQSYIGEMGATDWTATFAAISVTVTPILLVFLALNRAIMRGMASGPGR